MPKLNTQAGEFNINEGDEMPEGVTCFYIVVYKTKKGDETKLSPHFNSKKEAINSKFYTGSELKRWIRIEAHDSWLKAI